MKAKMGRPPLPKGKSKDVQIGVRFNPGEDRKIEKAIADAGQKKAAWVRDAAVREAKRPPVWVKSKWKREDLQDKTVQFRLIAPNLKVEGTGKFILRENPAGELAIEISSIKSATPYQVIESRFYLFQPIADKIKRHPDTAIADFHLLM